MVDEASTRPEFSLRQAKPDDYPFMLALYLDGSAGLLEKIGRWDERRVVTRFERAYKQDQARVIRAVGGDVGWIQIVDFVGRLHLRQLHLIAPFRGRGIGTRLIEDLQARGRRVGKSVTLDVIHGNRAKELYIRLGFQPTKADLDKTRMVWKPPSTASIGRRRAAGGIS
jgi:ribosomal protein S18 acetylase RimI-like enzyme